MSSTIEIFGPRDTAPTDLLAAAESLGRVDVSFMFGSYTVYIRVADGVRVSGDHTSLSEAFREAVTRAREVAGALADRRGQGR